MWPIYDLVEQIKSLLGLNTDSAGEENIIPLLKQVRVDIVSLVEQIAIPSDNVKLSSTTVKNQSSATYVVAKSLMVGITGEVRLTYKHRCNTDSYDYKVKCTKNGATVGEETLRSVWGGDFYNYRTTIRDIYVEKGDVLEIWIYRVTSTDYSHDVENVTVGYDLITPGIFLEE